MSTAIVGMAHGDLGEALIRAVEMIMAPPSDLKRPLPLTGRAPTARQEKLAAAPQPIGDRPILLRVDLLGGTPFSVAACCLPGGHTACGKGVHLPMLPGTSWPGGRKGFRSPTWPPTPCNPAETVGRGWGPDPRHRTTGREAGPFG